MSEIDPQRKKVAVLAAAIATLNMPFMLLMEHMQGSRYYHPMVVFYLVAMAALVVYTAREFLKLKRGLR
jgi:hypothetical protein